MAIDINIPSQVKNYANLAAFPATGSLKTIFIAEDTNKTYRWTGSAYVEISATAASTWGAIGGTLSNQTDLQTALNAKQDSLGFTAVPNTRTLTINGTTQDLSADRTFTVSTGITIGTTAITSGTVGRVLFEGTGNVVQESANLFWDNTNGRLGIGTSSPSRIVEIVGSAPVVRISGNTVTFAGIQMTNNGGDFWVGRDNSGGSSFGLNSPAYSGVINARGSYPLLLGAADKTAIYVFPTTTNVHIGAGTSIPTDAGFKLDVNGTVRVSGSATIQTLTVGLGASARSNNTVLGLAALISNTTGNFNVAIGPSSLSNNTTGTGNISVGHFSAVGITTGINNVALGREALSNGNSTGNVAIGFQACSTATGTNNIVIGLQSQAGNFNESIVLGINASATAGNQFVVGSTGTNAGSVTTEVNASTQVWNVIINGVARKILLA